MGTSLNIVLKKITLSVPTIFIMRGNGGQNSLFFVFNISRAQALRPYYTHPTLPYLSMTNQLGYNWYKVALKFNVTILNGTAKNNYNRIRKSF